MRAFLVIAIILGCNCLVWAAVDGGVSGSITDPQGVAIPNAVIKVINSQGTVVKEVTSSITGDYQIFPLTFGDYDLAVELPNYSPYRTTVHVASGGTTQSDIQLASKEAGKEMVLQVKAKKHLIQNSTSVSSTEISREQIKQLPQGDEITLPKLLTTTMPGAVQGPFGQVFFRGNHANIQYQIDGIQLPDSPSNTFGQAFSPRNIDHMEVITGGIPSEYGERLAAVVNIVTKSGPETPGGEVELNYGSYNTTSPHMMYGGSNSAGSVHYYLSANYNQTDRGLDTPQPASTTNQKQGGTDAVHDKANGNSEFGKVDWLVDNENKLSFILFNSMNHYEIPNYPSSFHVTDAMFNQIGFVDQFGNGGSSTGTTFNYVPANTDDWQNEMNSYLQVIWKHTFDERSFLQVAPYYKYSYIKVQNDPTNDLATSASGATPIAGSSPSSFYEDRHVDNAGVKADYTLHKDEKNLIKAGVQAQYSRASGNISVQTDLATPAVTDREPDVGYFESLYVQDDYTISKALILNAGIRFDATQFHFSGINPTDSLLQPRIGLNYLANETTKYHVFYGKLFQPAPAENLRDTFINSGSGQLAPYDIKAEKDDYYEIGAAKQFTDTQVVMLNLYYKDAKNMLDDAQLLNTSIAQPYNFEKGYAYGAELSLKGEFATHWSDFFNYSYEIAKGKGISGGIFAFPVGTPTDTDYQMLDHVQISTANAGVTYSKDQLWWTTELLFGSGLRTGPDNSISLPSHFTVDMTVGKEFVSQSWMGKYKASLDLLNLFNNVYPISVANGFNGSHYAAGFELFGHLSKEL